MARKKHVTNPYAVESLQSKVRHASGLLLDKASDCTLLALDVYRQTGARLNEYTLKRFFGFIKSDFNPSAQTLDILSRYCRYASFEELQQEVRVQPKRRKAVHDYTPAELTRFIKSIYNIDGVRDVNDETFLKITRRMIKQMMEQPALFRKLNSYFAQHKLGQTFYYEQFVHIDQLNSHYRDGLEQYLRHKQDDEAQLFGKCVLYLGEFLTGNATKQRFWIKQIIHQNVSKQLHPFVCGRYFGCRVLHASYHGGENVHTVIDEAFRFHQGVEPSGDNYKDFPCFEWVLAEHLILAHRYDDALEMLNYASVNYPVKPSYVDEGFYQSMDLYKAICLAALGDVTKAKNFFKNVQPDRFYFLSCKYFTLHYLKLKGRLGGRLGLKDAALFKQLLDETGFVFFKEHEIR